MIKRLLKDQFGLTFLLAFIVFCSMTATMLITTFFALLLIRTGVIATPEGVTALAWRMVLIIALISFPVGILVAAIATKVPLKPIRELIDGMDRLSSGDFATRVTPGSVMKNYPHYVQLAESFNKMAAELENTEVLRSDFINNFSHEFKTPIVSIAGFARLLKKGNLSPTQQREYLGIIEEESLRLSYMATNVLNLTKIENQSILTDTTQFNLSEQLRSCVLLLEDEWARKELDFQMEFGEISITANEEMLKEVWINLLDNAIKFSPQCGEIRLDIHRTESAIRVSVTNFGSEIPAASHQRIFDKFYQVDKSHAGKGNGIGLAIVKRVAELHGGRVSVSSGNGVTTFTVELPIRN